MPNLNRVWTDGLRAFATPGPREEALSWDWFHMRRQATGAFAATQQFFNVPKGGTDGAVVVSELESNMEKASSITAPKRFMATGIGVILTPESHGAAMLDVATSMDVANSIEMVSSNTVLELYLSDKLYLREPVLRTPGGAGLAGFSGTSDSVTDYVCNGVPAEGNIFPLLLPIPYELAFSANLTNPKGFTTTADIRITVFMTGILIRPLQ